MKNTLFLTLALIVLFGACAQKKETALTILGENSATIQAMQFFKTDYESKHPVKLDFKPNTFEDAFTKGNQDFANKTGQYDIVLQYNFSLSSFVKNAYVYKLGELKSKSNDSHYEFENDIFENVWREVGYYYADPRNPDENSVEPIAYPFAANTMLLVYNKDLFNDPAQKKAYKLKYGEELKAPTDMNSFKRVAEFFTQPDKGLHGVSLQGATGGWLYYEWCAFVQGFNGKVLDKDHGWRGNASTPVLLATPEVTAATSYYISLKPYNAGNFTTVDGVEQRNIIKQGKVAMGIIWSDYVWGLLDDGNGKMDGRFGFTPTPGTKSMIAGGSFYINRQSKHSDAVFQYVKYLLQKETQVKMLQRGLCSPIKSAYDAAEVQNIPFVPALKASLERAVYMLEAGPDADLINNTITTYVQKAWGGQVSVKNGLKMAKEEIERERTKFYQ